jgi:hypothetical protein
MTCGMRPRGSRSEPVRRLTARRQPPVQTTAAGEAGPHALRPTLAAVRSTASLTAGATPARADARRVSAGCTRSHPYGAPPRAPVRDHGGSTPTGAGGSPELPDPPRDGPPSADPTSDDAALRVSPADPRPSQPYAPVVDTSLRPRAPLPGRANTAATKTPATRDGVGTETAGLVQRS